MAICSGGHDPDKGTQTLFLKMSQAPIYTLVNRQSQPCQFISSPFKDSKACAQISSRRVFRALTLVGKYAFGSVIWVTGRDTPTQNASIWVSGLSDEPVQLVQRWDQACLSHLHSPERAGRGLLASLGRTLP